MIGNTIVEAGEADAGVIAPLQDLESYVHQGTHPDWELTEEDRWRGVAVAGDGCGRYGRISALLQGKNAAIESMRNVVAVGATPRALTDCLNYGNPEIPEQLQELADGIDGIAAAAEGVTLPDGEHVPIISGNVSLYNGNPDGSSLDPTAIVSCTGVMADARKAVTMQLKESGSALYLLGERKDECGGSAYYEVLEDMLNADRDALLGANVPNPDVQEVSSQFASVLSAIDQNLVNASHDISTGGLLMTLFEMTLPQRKIGGTIGIDIDLSTLETTLPADKILFSETGGFVFEVSKEHQPAFEKVIPDAVKIGVTTEESVLKISDSETAIVDSPLETLYNIWKNGLKKCGY